MYEYIIGKIEWVGPEYIVIDHNGMGYQLFTPNPYVFRPSNEILKVYTHHYVREDVMMLYGFKTLDERTLFQKLLSVSGIGPKGALAIVATGDPNQIVHAIEEEDEVFLTKFPGVGKKTARQMILDLKGKLEKVFGAVQVDLFTDLDAIEEKESAASSLDDAIEALKALGYAEKEVKKIVPLLKNEKLSTDEYIKKALQLLLQAKR
ncbi:MULTISPECIES: Holliday junction branch migration protein RuvA [Bacillaceae]|uniref:Holliday junction branch migration protein RuvA n=1 Tax=Bacillaceae TaxID=186817 RepID=UPI000BEE30C8|nr:MULTISPECIES: Holliday junction branch migration protein RuvA [unclassified Bacillus (in: firmicutes)]PEC47498.1 Holliday junction branch migration protein RuvA [Bacillus sp. AFS096315]PFM76092.1 Holliday junction branch migration protein RuvA [Bacillus sp. AFS077874]